MKQAGRTTGPSIHLLLLSRVSKCYCPPSPMKVPFEKIGPGQSGRLVYQVMGENGPIFNPNRISYLPADQAPSLGDQPSNLPSVYTSLAAMNLAASVGIVALSAAVLRQVQQLHA